MDGFINCLKPSGPTASDIVVRLKKIYGQKRIGHLGTLDPGAAGVLPIAVGKATKFFDLLTFKKKRYRAYFYFGKTTDTLDSYGVLTQEKPFFADEEEIIKATQEFVGKIKQIPPIYSALSIGGTKAYDRARRGEEFEIKAREVEVFSFDLVRKVDENVFCFDICCGGGTYIRSLARDLGEKLNSVAYMSCLLRLSSGAFNIEDAVMLEEIEKNPIDCLLPVQFPLQEYPELVVPQNMYKQLANGVKLLDWREKSNTISDIVYRIYCDNEFFGVGGFDNLGRLVLNFRLKD